MASHSFLTFCLICTLNIAVLPLIRAENLEHVEVQIADQLLDKSRYDHRIRPNTSNPDDPIEVLVSMFVMDMKVDQENMASTVNAYIRQRWNDPRLAYGNQNTKLSTITTANEENIWKPDLFFTNEIKGHRHQLITDNTFLKIYPNGDAFYSVRVTLKLACPMEFKLFPFDSQVCPIEIESYRYTADDINLRWTGGEFSMSDHMIVPEFKVIDSSSESSTVQTLSGLKYSRLVGNIKIKREFKYYLTYVYIPLYNVILVSWISFWLKLNPVSFRFAYMLTVYAISIILIMVINCNTLVMSVTSAQNVWTGGCLTFIFGAFLECLVVFQLSLKEQKEGDDQGIEEVVLDKGTIDGETEKGEVQNRKNDTETKLFSKYLNKYKNKSERIDVISRIVFPILFIVFNIIYWSYYCTAS